MTVKIEERVGVQASQERVWEVLSNFEDWKDWNPTNPRVEGRLAIGAGLKIEQRLPGQAAEVLDARVVDWIPLEQIHWRTDLARGWAWTVRYLEIEPLGPNNCVFSCGELFGGFLGGYLAKRMRPSIRKGFTAFCEALRVEAEKGAAKPEPKSKAPAKTKAAASAKKVPLKPMPLKSYAPQPLGMKKKP